MKTYKYTHGTNLFIGENICFYEGVYSSNDEKEQKTIEAHPLFLDGQIYIQKEERDEVSVKQLSASDLPADNKCPYCDFVGRNKTALILHLRKHPEVKYIKEE